MNGQGEKITVEKVKSLMAKSKGGTGIRGP